MKKILVFSVLFCISLALANAQSTADPVVMTVAEKPVSLSEFLFIAQKDSSVDLNNRKSLKNYVELFKNFKLKVADAEAAGIQRSSSFSEELNTYKGQLRLSFLSDKTGEEDAIRNEYNRMKEQLTVSQLLFKLPRKAVSKDTVAIYEKALEAYKQIQQGTPFSTLAKELANKESGSASFDENFYLIPLKTPQAFEDAAYSLPVGVVSAPVRSPLGFHLIKVEKRIPNPGLFEVAHILINVHEKRNDEEAAKTAQQLYDMLKNGDDFSELAKKYSSDEATASKGGVLPVFGLGDMVKPFEDAAFSLSNPGDFSRPVKTRYGYHIIKLIDKKEVPSFEEKRPQIYSAMRQDEHNFTLYSAFDKKMKEAYGYRLYQDAYDDFQRLSDQYFPTDSAFYAQSKDWKKPLLRLNGEDHLQEEFAYYIYRFPFSTKSYSGDFIREVFDLFVRDLYTELERKKLDTNPEFDHLIQEYRDGILLFEISNQRVWSKPVAEQAQLEKEWIRELQTKYPVTVNWDILNNLKKYRK